MAGCSHRKIPHMSGHRHKLFCWSYFLRICCEEKYWKFCFNPITSARVKINGTWQKDKTFQNGKVNRVINGKVTEESVECHEMVLDWSWKKVTGSSFYQTSNKHLFKISGGDDRYEINVLLKCHKLAVNKEPVSFQTNQK